VNQETMVAVRAVACGDYTPRWTDVLTRSEWNDQAREDRRTFEVVVALLRKSPSDRKWAVTGLLPGDLEAVDARVMEAIRRLEVAVATLQDAHDVLVDLIQGTIQ
jgi:hypothetical protein